MRINRVTVEYPLSERGPLPEKPFAWRDPSLTGSRLYRIRKAVGRKSLHLIGIVR
jgi:hypothetical protein